MVYPLEELQVPMLAFPFWAACLVQGYLLEVWAAWSVRHPVVLVC